jgi:hypothetical protein
MREGGSYNGRRLGCEYNSTSLEGAELQLCNKIYDDTSPQIH